MRNIMYTMEKHQEFKLTIPFVYTISRRLSSPSQILFYFIHNLFFPVSFILLLKVNFPLVLFCILWVSTHLVYEIGYFMNDYLATDSRLSTRKFIDIELNKIIGILLIKTTSVFVIAFFFVPNNFYFILITLFLVYIVHNQLIKKYRISTFFVLRFLKFSPFWFFLSGLELYIFIFFFATLSIKEALNSYVKNSFWTNYVDLIFFIVFYTCIYYGYTILSFVTLIYVFNKIIRLYVLRFFSNK